MCLTSNSTCLLLVYIKTIVVFIIALDPDTLLSLIISSDIVDSFEFSIQSINSQQTEADFLISDPKTFMHLLVKSDCAS